MNTEEMLTKANYWQLELDNLKGTRAYSSDEKLRYRIERCEDYVNAVKETIQNNAIWSDLYSMEEVLMVVLPWYVDWAKDTFRQVNARANRTLFGEKADESRIGRYLA